MCFGGCQIDVYIRARFMANPSPLDRLVQCLTRALWEGSPRSGSGPPPCAKNRAGRCCAPMASVARNDMAQVSAAWTSDVCRLQLHKAPQSAMQQATPSLLQPRCLVISECDPDRWLSQEHFEEQSGTAAIEVVSPACKIIGCTCWLQ